MVEKIELVYHVALLIPLVWLLLRYFLKEQKNVTYFSNYEMLRSIASKSINWGFYLKFLIVAMLSLALATPMLKKSHESQKTSARDIAIILDASDSMAEDNRFETSKKIISKFIDKRVHDRISLTLFADQTYTASALTNDTKSLQTVLDYVKLGVAGDRMTALNESIYLSAKLFDDDAKSEKIAILLTDGLNTVDSIPLSKALVNAKEKNVKIYTIGVGDDYSAEILQEISSRTGGKFYQTKNSNDLEDIYVQIDKLEKNEISTSVRAEYSYLYIYPLVVALILSVILILRESVSLVLLILIVSLATAIFIITKSAQNDINLQRQSNISTLYIAIDISKSMNTDDVFPTRLEAAKNKLQQIVPSIEVDKLSVVAFSKQAYLLVPPTSNKRAVVETIGRLDVSSVSQNGTNILATLQAIDSMSNNEYQKIVLIATDGGEKESYLAEKNFARKHNISMLVYGVGTLAGGALKDDGQTQIDKYGNIITTALNPNIAELTNDDELPGAAFTVGVQDINKISKQLTKSLGNSADAPQEASGLKTLYILLLVALLAIFEYSLGKLSFKRESL